jgi:outer membrane receptor protein involved in Fe transport
MKPSALPQRYVSPALLLGALLVFAAPLGATEAAPSGPATVLPGVVVTPGVQADFSLGTGTYGLSSGQIENLAQGPDSAFTQVLVRAPGVSQDSAGQVHFREEDPYYQYYVDDILLPRGINGFGQDVDTLFVDAVTLKVGALPAQYAWGNYGIIAAQTKAGASLQGNEISYYGGSYDTSHLGAASGGTSGNTDYFLSGSYLHDSLGIENPTASARAVHDRTDQSKVFGYLSRKLTDTSSLSFIFSGAHADFQIPNNPDQASVLEFAEPFPAADSSLLNETQTEQSYYGVVAFKRTAGDWSLQIAQVNRYSGVLFRPDENGDLYFNGVASRVFRDILTNGAQGDFTYQAGGAHTLRGGLLFDTEAARDHNSVAVFDAGAVDPDTGAVVATEPPFAIQDDHFKRGYDGTLYMQDEWKVSDRLTLNYGGRFDRVDAYVHESQVSPRISVVYQASPATTWHAGYARYFIPPPLENVSPTSVGKFDGTTNAADQDTDDPVKCERSHYFDAGVIRKLSPAIQIGVDGYYKRATDQVDDGQFGAANITSPYNYARATIYGGEFSASYAQGGFSAYGNFAAAQARATDIVSSEFEFDADELAYIATHNIYLDQTQFFTSSAGASYAWRQTTVHADVIYGSGMRRGFANTETLPAYAPVNVGMEYRFKLAGSYEGTFRLDVINLFDQSYVLNDGTGIGVGAPKFGMRRGYFGGISCRF